MNEHKMQTTGNTLRNVCIFCETWESGGIESFLTNLITHMDRSCLHFDIVAAQLRPSVYTEQLKEVGVTFFELSGKQRNLLQNYRRFCSLLQQRQYDVIHLNAFQALSMYYLKLACDFGVPKRIIHSHNTALRKTWSKKAKELIHFLSKYALTRYATSLWACSDMAARFMFPKRCKYQFIPNGIDLQRFSFHEADRIEVRRKLNIPESYMLIGNIGRLCYQKNQRFLLDVLFCLKNQNISAKLLLVGDGEDKELLRQYARTLGIEPDVIFYGVTNRPEVLYSAIDVFAFPSLFEGLGIVALEAQANGLAVICSEYIPMEALATEQAFMVKLDADLWAERLIRLNGASRSTDLVHLAPFDIHQVTEAYRAFLLCDLDKVI